MKTVKIVVESVFKQMAAENRAKKAAANQEYKDSVKSAAADKAKNKYQHIAQIVNTEVANHYPDADPFDSIASKVQKHYGHDFYSVMPHLDKAVKQHLGSKNYNEYVEDFDKDYRKDNGLVHESSENSNEEHSEGTIHSIEDVPGSGGAKKFVVHGNNGKPIMFNDTRQGHTIKQVTPSKKVGDKVKVKHIYSGYHSLPFDQV